ncbi:MAG: hypothetical protein Q6K92_09690, partial [Thermostichus sp. DG_1_5_bins_95]
MFAATAWLMGTSGTTPWAAHHRGIHIYVMEQGRNAGIMMCYRPKGGFMQLFGEYKQRFSEYPLVWGTAQLTVSSSSLSGSRSSS